MRRLTTRIITSALSVCMVLGGMPAYAYAASEEDGVIMEDDQILYDVIVPENSSDIDPETTDILPLGDTDVDVEPPFTLSGEGFSYDYTFDEETGTLTVTGSGDCHYLFYDNYTAKDNPWVFYNRKKINKVILNSTGLVNASNLFHGLLNVTEIDLSGFDSSTVTDMSNMFDSCFKLTTVDVSGLDTSKVTDMKYMFNSCWELETIDVSKFDTSQVTDMAGMFSFCKVLNGLDLSSFDTSNVTDMEYMFSDCGALTSLDLSSFNTSNVTNMRSMFLADSKLESLNVSSFNTSNVTDMTCIFSGLSSLPTLDFTNFDTSKVEKFEKFIGHCKSLTSVDLSHIDTSSATDMSNMFEECIKLTSLDVSHFDVSKVKGMNFMFEYCSSLKSLDLSNWNVASVESMAGFIQFDYALESFKTPYNNTDEYYLPVTMYDENNVEYTHSTPIATTKSLNLHVAASDPVDPYTEEDIAAVKGYDSEHIVLIVMDGAVPYGSNSNIHTLTAKEAAYLNDSFGGEISYSAGRKVALIKNDSVTIRFRAANYDKSKQYEVNASSDMAGSLSGRLKKGDNGSYTIQIILGVHRLEVTVTNKNATKDVPVTGITLSGEGLNSIPVGCAVTVNKTIAPAKATNKSIRWESSAPDIAEVTASGSVIGKKEGSADIKAYALDGSGVESNEISVTVVSALTDYADEEEVYEVLEKDEDDPNRSESLWITTINDENIFYTGKAIKPVVRVYDGNRLLKEKTDYTLSYSNNKAAYEIVKDDNDTEETEGENADKLGGNYIIEKTLLNAKIPTVTAKLKGNYSGSLKSTFSIHAAVKDPVSLKKAVVTTEASYAYDGRPVEPKPVVKLGNDTLTEGTDYVVTYSGNDKVGKAKYSVIGTGCYFGTKQGTFKITGRSFDNTNIQINDGKTDLAAVYSASGAKLSLKVTYGSGEGAILLKEGVDYTVKYSNNKAVTGANTQKKPAVTLTGKGFYTGKIKKEFKIYKKDFSVVNVMATDKVEPSKAGKYTTTIKVTDLDGTVLKSGKDYEKTIQYIAWDPETETKGDILDKNSKPKAGDVIRVEIKGKGNYTDTVKAGYYRIISAGMDISKATVKIKDQMFVDKNTAVEIPNNDAQFVVNMGKTMIGLACDRFPDGFEVVPGSYVNNTKCGKAKVTLHGTGKYGGYKTVTFKITARKNTVGFPGFDGPTLTKPQYVEGELICLVSYDSDAEDGAGTTAKEEAQKIADDYGIEVKNVSYGVAVFDCGDKDLGMLIEFGKAHGLTELSYNFICYLDDGTFTTDSVTKQHR